VADFAEGESFELRVRDGSVPCRVQGAPVPWPHENREEG
jgi:hypothetical protein